MPGLGTSLGTSLGISPLLLQIESVILGAFLLFALASAWGLRSDPSVLLPRSRLSAGIAFAAVAISSAALLTHWGGEHALLAIELPMIAAVSLIHPSLGLGAFVLMLLIRPWELGGAEDPAFALIPRFSAGIAILGAISAIVRNAPRSGQKRLLMAWGAGVIWVLAFSSWTLFSILKTPNPAQSFNQYLDVLSKPILVFLIAINTLQSERGLRAVRGSLICGAIGIASIAIANTYFGSATRIVSVGALADPNDISAVMILITPFAVLPLLRKNEALATRLFSLLSLAITLVLLYLAKSRGALLAFLVMSASFTLIRMRSRKTALISAAIALLLFAPLTSLFNRSGTDLSESSESRIIYWETALRMALRNPVLGVGYGGYPTNFDAYAPRFLDEYGYRTAHSSWFLVLGETGPIGLFLFAGFCIYVFREAWRIREPRPEFVLSAIGYGVAMTFLSHSYTLYPYLLGALILAAARLERKAEMGCRTS